MPPINHAILASAGVIAVSVAVAAAIVIYESPEIRRAAEDLRRRIAIALHSLGDNLDPEQREPVFNRPEDAEGFLVSRGAADQGVDADEETMRRQREELLYWNAQREANRSKSDRRVSRRGSRFDDFLEQDQTALPGTLVASVNTGADLTSGYRADQSLLRRRGGLAGLKASNPFSDEYGIDSDEHSEDAHVSPGDGESVSDIYNATPRDGRSMVSNEFGQSKPVVPEVLFDFDAHSRSQSATMEEAPATERSVTLERELAEDEFMTAGQEDSAEAYYASIQAWAHGATNPTGFYSPLPDSPAAPLSEPEVISDGARTPTDSASTAGSGEDVANDAASSAHSFDMVSVASDGMATPDSWSEVGSTISGSEN